MSFGKYEGGHLPDDDDKDYQLENAKSNKSKTPSIDVFGRDYTKMASEGKFDPVIGRDAEIEQLIETLNKRKKNSPVLIGEAGVGKSAVVEGFAQKIASMKDIESAFLNCRVVEISLASVIAGTKYRGQFEERMQAIIQEAVSNPEIILFIDELHTVIGAGNAAGGMDAGNILKPSLARGEIRIIGATTFDEYHKNIEKDKAFDRRFQRITVKEPTKDETLEILNNIKYKYEEHHFVSYSKEIIETICNMSQRYITNKRNPDKSIDLMDKIGSKIGLKNSPKQPEEINELNDLFKKEQQNVEEAKNKQAFEEAGKARDKRDEIEKELELLEEKWVLNKTQKIKEVTFEDVASVISSQTGVPVSNLTEDDMDRLVRMSDIVKAGLINQDEAVEKVSEAIQRSRTGVSKAGRPIGSFLFLGPTGVGKTQMVKELSKFLFNSEDKIVRFDMSEYSQKFETTKLIGSPPGYVGNEEGGQLTEKIKNNPHSIVLFDEIEKAHPDFKNMLLQVLDEGTLTDSNGEKVDFSNTIVIMTSNIGTSKILSQAPVGFASSGDQVLDIESSVMAELKKHPTTSPEFINRIDEVVVFNPLDKDAVIKIMDIQLKDLINRMKQGKKIKLTITKAAKNLVADKGYDKAYGARPLNRSIMKYVENVLSKGILTKSIINGDSVTIDAKDGETFIKKKKVAE